MGEGDARRQGGDRKDRHPRPRRQPAVGRLLRHNGFLTGFGIPVKNPKHYAQSDSPQIVGSDVTQGSTEGGRKAMENILQKADQIDLVYAINEPSAYGGIAALKAAGKEKGVIDRRGRRRLLRAIKWVKEGIIGATSQQYPLLMAADGVEAIAEYIKTGKKPHEHRHRREARHRPTCPASPRSPSKRA